MGIPKTMINVPTSPTQTIFNPVPMPLGSPVSMVPPMSPTNVAPPISPICIAPPMSPLYFTSYSAPQNFEVMSPIFMPSQPIYPDPQSFVIPPNPTASIDNENTKIQNNPIIQ